MASCESEKSDRGKSISYVVSRLVSSLSHLLYMINLSTTILVFFILDLDHGSLECNINMLLISCLQCANSVGT